MPPTLAELAECSLVQIRRAGGGYAGAGFVIAPGLVVTNAHVAEDGVTVVAGGISYGCRVLTRCPPENPAGREWPLPDLAELEVPGLPVPPVLLGPAVAGGVAEMMVPTFDLTTIGDSTRPAATRSAFLRVAGVGDRWKLQDNTVEAGMSGSPVIDRETGRVCGMVKSAAWFTAPRGAAVPTGGWMIPLSSGHAPASWFERNAAANPYGNEWRLVAAGAGELQGFLFDPDEPPEEITPASLLDPEGGHAPFEIVPEYAELLRWCVSAEPALLRLVSGTSGAGKNRVAVELCRRLRERGWLAGFLGEAPDEQWHRSLARALRLELQVCIVVDDAEHRGDDLRMILRGLRAAAGRHAAMARVVLLSRNDPDRFENEFFHIDIGRDRIAPWIRSVLAPPVLMPPVLRDPDGVLGRAFHAFAGRLGVTVRSEPVWRRDLSGVTTLELYAMAADAVLSRLFEDESDGPAGADPLAAIRGHQLRYWARKLMNNGYSLRHGPRSPPGRRQIVIPLAAAEAWMLLPTLAAAGDEQHLRRVMDGAVVALGAPGRADLDDLYALYPSQPGRDGTRMPAVLAPDRLAELMFREVCRSLGEVRLRDFLAAVLWLAPGTRASRDGYAHPALRLIGRARGASEIAVADDEAYGKIDRALSLLLAAHPAELLPALAKVGGELPNAVPLVRLLDVAALNTAPETCRGSRPTCRTTGGACRRWRSPCSAGRSTPPRGWTTGAWPAGSAGAGRSACTCTTWAGTTRRCAPIWTRSTSAGCCAAGASGPRRCSPGCTGTARSCCCGGCCTGGA